MQCGYGEISRLILDSLHRLGCVITAANSLRWGHCKRTTTRYDHLIYHPDAPVDRLIIVGSPHEVYALRGSYPDVRLITTGVEVQTGILPGDVHAINDLDRAAFTAERVLDMYRLAGAGQHTSFLPICVPPPKTPPKERIGNFRNFLCVAQFCERKNLKFLLDCWKSANRPDSILRLKTNLGTYSEAEEAHIRAALEIDQYPRVELIHRELTAAEMEELYRQADVYVSVSRGEGLGLPELFASRHHCSVITADGAVGERVKCDVVPVRAANLQGVPVSANATWLAPRKDDVVRLIRNPPKPSVYPADYSQPAMDRAMRAFLA